MFYLDSWKSYEAAVLLISKLQQSKSRISEKMLSRRLRIFTRGNHALNQEVITYDGKTETFKLNYSQCLRIHDIFAKSNDCFYDNLMNTRIDKNILLDESVLNLDMNELNKYDHA